MAFEESKVATDQVHEVRSDSTAPKPTLGAKLKAHLRKWWWAHLIFFIASTLIIVLCLIYVAFPRISQDGINDSTLEINSLVLSSPTTNTFHLRQNGTVGNKSNYHPNLDAFNATLSLHDGKPYAEVEIPKLHATERAISIIDQDVTITDLDAFTEYTAAVLNNEEIQVDVKGRTALHEMRFPTTHVDYDKTVTMKGLNKLTGFAIPTFSIKLTPEPDGANMLGTVLLPNPSVMTISMGNVTFTNYLPANPTASPPTPRIPIGTSTLSDLVLAPGDNTIPMRSKINQTLVIGAIAKTFKDGMLPVEIVGESAVYDGQHLGYFETALKALTQRVTLDVGKALQEAGVDQKTLAALAAGGGESPPTKGSQ